MPLMARQYWTGCLALILLTACAVEPTAPPSGEDSGGDTVSARFQAEDIVTEPSPDGSATSQPSDEPDAELRESDTSDQPASDVPVLRDTSPLRAEDTPNPDDAEAPQDAQGPADDSAVSTPDTGEAPGEDSAGSSSPDVDGEPDAEVAPEGPVCGDGGCTEGETSVACPEDCGGVACEPIGAPAPVSPAPHPGTSPGVWETTQVDGFTDDYLVRADGELKIGIRRDWGATIIFFGFSGDAPGTNTTNTIDSHDTGREVQVAFYDATRIVQGCAFDASCQPGGGPCANSITFLGWNPVQGGNECNIGSGVEWVSASEGILRSETIPLFWNPNWLSQGCDNGGCGDPALQASKSDVSYTQSLRWVSEHVVEMTMSVQNLSALDHPVTLQEFPTLYATFGHQGTQDLNVILDATGAQIAIDQPANDGFFVKEFNSPGGWAALQNSDQTYGVGLYYENELGSFQGWQKAGVFNNIRSKFPFAIPAFGTVMGRAYLVLGGYGTISAEVAELQSGLAPFGLLESPAPEAVLGAPTVTLKGWALDNRGVVEVRALIDGVLVTTTTPSMDRPDVCLSWPLYPGCPQVGFEVELDLSAVSPCPHLLELEAVDTDGNARIIARQRIYPGDPPTDTPSCGDGSCNGAESAASCPSDCPSVCGDGDCVAGETNPTCPADCPPVCGDAFCDEGEVCADDCGEVEGAEEVVLLHRYFYSAGNDHDHMFGPSTVPPEGYSYEGPAFQVYEQGGPGLAPLYQSYCGACTDHLQTMSQDESSPSYVAPVLLGYVGIGQSSATPKALQRVYSAEASDHFLTANPNEASALESAGYLIEATYWAP